MKIQVRKLKKRKSQKKRKNSQLNVMKRSPRKRIKKHQRDGAMMVFMILMDRMLEE